jgi:hypothetical protein
VIEERLAFGGLTIGAEPQSFPLGMNRGEDLARKGVIWSKVEGIGEGWSEEVVGDGG